MSTTQLFNDWQSGPEGQRISSQLEGWSIGERLWALAEAYRASQQTFDSLGSMPNG